MLNNNGLINFRFNTREVRTILIDKKPYFVGCDIAENLGYNEPHKAVARHCKGGTKHPIPTNGGNQEMVIIPQGDVFRLIIKSRLPEAQKFESWIMDEVLPTLMKTGSYSMNMRLTKNPTPPVDEDGFYCYPLSFMFYPSRLRYVIDNNGIAWFNVDDIDSVLELSNYENAAYNKNRDNSKCQGCPGYNRHEDRRNIYGYLHDRGIALWGKSTSTKHQFLALNIGQILDICDIFKTRRSDLFSGILYSDVRRYLTRNHRRELSALA